MIKYVCHNCNDLECETSVCPVCKNRASLMEATLFYCPECNAPCFDDVCPSCGSKTFRIGNDVRPVFPEERLLLEVLLGEPMKYAGSSVWCVGTSLYLVDGKKLHVSLSELKKIDPAFVREQLAKYSGVNKPYVESFCESQGIKSFVRINKTRLATITDEAIEYIRRKSKDYGLGEMFVSFSGGKDSTVTSHLVMKALGTESIVHIYGDTTLEYPTTHTYM